MLGSHILAEAARGPDRRALIHGARQASYGELAGRIEALTASWRGLAGKRVGLAVQDAFTFVTAAAALDRLGAHAFLAGGRADADLAELRKTFSWDAILREEDASHPQPLSHDAGRGENETGIVTILTSGTTGTPKAANHTWATLASPVRRDDRYRDTRWLAVYPLHLYAGTQVLLQALLNGAVLVTLAGRDPVQAAQTLRDAAVTHASATPTFWRQLLLFADRETLRDCPLQQITLGGETVGQDVLDGLAGVFPRARIVHIYASTESGRLFAVTDGKEGFPVRYLESSPEEGIELRVHEGQLLARSRHAMLGYENQPAAPAADGWHRTGDLVEVRGDRVLFAGRASEMINVGGAKVHPSQVERVIREAPGVADVRVYGRASALVGAVVVADVQPLPDADPKQVQAAVGRLTRERLQPFQVPQLVRMVAQIEVSQAGKVIRAQPS